MIFEIIKKMIDDIVLVDDYQIIKTMFLLMERAKMVVEPAGAAGLAYLLQANITLLDIFGDYKLNKFHSKTSKRLILLFK